MDMSIDRLFANLATLYFTIYNETAHNYKFSFMMY